MLACSATWDDIGQNLNSFTPVVLKALASGSSLHDLLGNEKPLTIDRTCWYLNERSFLRNSNMEISSLVPEKLNIELKGLITLPGAKYHAQSGLSSCNFNITL